MINKRLINLCSESKKYIALTIFVNWLAVICNILTVLLIGQFINRMAEGQRLVLDNNNLISAMSQFNLVGNISLLTAVIAIICLLAIRYTCNILYAKFSNSASAGVRIRVRELIYKKFV